MPRLTQAELDEAAVKRNAVILASQAIIRARFSKAEMGSAGV